MVQASPEQVARNTCNLFELLLAAERSPLRNVSEAADLLGMPPKTVRRRIRAGLLPAFTTPGGQYRITEDAIAAFADSTPTPGVATGIGSASRPRLREPALDAGRVTGPIMARRAS